MLTYLLAFAIALASIGLYAMTFFLPAFKREQDLIWSGVGLFYALVLWICAGQVRGGLLLGQMASVALIGWLGWQAFIPRWEGLSAAEKDQAKVLTEIKDKFSNIDFGKLGDQAKGLASKAKDSAAGLADKAKDVAGNAQGLADKAKDVAGNVADKAKDVASDVTDKAKDVAADVKDTAKDAAPKSSEPYVRKAFQNTTEAVKDAIAETAETVKEVASDVVETAAEEIKDATPDA
jgi:methyl-accepting chemotaxis protein